MGFQSEGGHLTSKTRLLGYTRHRRSLGRDALAIEQKLVAKHGFSDALLSLGPLVDGTIPHGDFHRDDAQKPVPKHDSTLTTRLITTSTKIQPCRTSSPNACDAIVQADGHLTGGENFCGLWQSFAECGHGLDTLVGGKTPWDGGVRTDDFKDPSSCLDKLMLKPTPIVEVVASFSPFILCTLLILYVWFCHDASLLEIS